MDQEVKRINNKDQLKQIVEKLFLTLPVRMQDNDQNLSVQVISYKDPLIEVSHQASQAENRKLVAEKGENSLLLECSVESRNGNTEFLKPVILHLTRKIRSMPRVNVPEKDKRLLWVTNLVTIQNFPSLLSSSNEKRDKLINAYKAELKKTFPRVEIFLRQTLRLDYRMRTLISEKKSIFIPNINTPESVNPETFVSVNEYLKLSRYDQIPEGIISEVTEPLFYKNYYLYGYIRVMSTKALKLEDYEIVRRVAGELNKHLANYGAFPVNREKSPVIDINTTGVGCMHPHVPQIMKELEPGENVIFDIHYPDDQIFTYTGLLKNIKSGERAHRLGIQFDPLDSNQIQPLERFIASLS